MKNKMGIESLVFIECFATYFKKTKIRFFVEKQYEVGPVG
ncbi:hypothetical protein CLV96_2574 [Leptospira meyeri]|uniref:Uncharacterized protein n=1 Tax=Leptospira meyeri TaxID=29508 RepID=A0A4R8MVI4_LEPME|nr:hypothetical protein CLV96_2574 [Leptospira meyeri]